MIFDIDSRRRLIHYEGYVKGLQRFAKVDSNGMMSRCEGVNHAQKEWDGRGSLWMIFDIDSRRRLIHYEGYVKGLRRFAKVDSNGMMTRCEGVNHAQKEWDGRLKVIKGGINDSIVSIKQELQEYSRTISRTLKNTIAFRESFSNIYNALSREGIWLSRRAQMG
ncbi:hypothetical protein LXL04_020868 [Taraxacum kok-saghyz]